jgi:hypothetical protein
MLRRLIGNELKRIRKGESVTDIYLEIQRKIANTFREDNRNEKMPESSSLLSTAELQGAAEITPTFQRGITNKWYEISTKTFYFPNVDIKKFFLL